MISIDKKEEWITMRENVVQTTKNVMEILIEWYLMTPDTKMLRKEIHKELRTQME